MLRTIAYNVLQCTGYPPGSRRAEACDPERYARALAAYAPDVVTFCESPAPEVVEPIARALGMTALRFDSPERWPGTLLTTLGVVEAANCPLPGGRPDDLFTRHWGRAVLRTHAGEEFVIHSAHLHPNDPTVREREVLTLLACMRPDLDGGRQVVLQGDLNHRPDMPEYEWWWNAGLFDTFEPEDGDPGYTYRSTQPLARLDYVWVGRSLCERVLRGRPLAEPPFIPDSEPGVGFALSDHIPQFAIIE